MECIFFKLPRNVPGCCQLNVYLLNYLGMCQDAASGMNYLLCYLGMYQDAASGMNYILNYLGMCQDAASGMYYI